MYGLVLTSDMEKLCVLMILGVVTELFRVRTVGMVSMDK